MFIAIEGADVCGKGTQTALLAQRLDAKTFKFPDKKTDIGKYIYDHLHGKWAAGLVVGKDTDDIDQPHLNALVFQCVHLACRLEHAEEIAQTIHTLNQDVVADRYIASGVVYGGFDGLDPDWLLKIQRWLPQPDLNILLDIELDVAKERMRSRGDTPDRYENEETLKGIIDRYRKFWAMMRDREEERWVVVNGSQPTIEVQADIIVAVKRWQAYNQG